MEESNSSRKRWISIAAVVGLLVISAVAYAATSKGDSAKPTAQATPTPSVAASGAGPSPSSEVASANTASDDFKDGTYNAVGNYQSPGGSQTVNVSLTVKDDVVTAANVTEGAIDATSRNYQQMFISGYQSQVVGKNLSDLQLTRVSGSSLTPRGFNDAVSKIQTQAKA